MAYVYHFPAIDNVGVCSYADGDSVPTANITPAEAEQAPGGQVALEGNIQIADLYEKTPAAMLMREYFTDRRGLAVSPTASPFIPGRGEECYLPGWSR